ncbi:unnamed protein product [Effrenium voratum]|uniref:Cyclin n=1 Tax=Effrenium voratum TaxID=2562239 RepID=A0AA36HSV0_9DINO|nr:unnamed protein product [Effrenium voratum]
MFFAFHWMGNAANPWRLCMKRSSSRGSPEQGPSQESHQSNPQPRHEILRDIKLAASKVTAEVLDEKAHIDGGKLIASLARVYGDVMDPASSARCASCFHGCRKPTISIEDYLVRLRSYFMCSDSCFLLALIYIARLVEICPDFAVNPFSIHRLLAISLVVSVKFHEDVVYSNTFYAHICGLQHEELNKGEVEFLKMIKWDLGFSIEQFSQVYSEVLQSADKIL